jgi:hypothetical protein
MKYIAPIAAVLAAALSAFSGPIQGLIASHPGVAGGLAALGALLAAIAPQPQK